MRRRTPPTSTPAPEIPERLRWCWVEDWVEPTEPYPHLPTTINGRPPDAEYIASCLLLLARRRHKEAVDEWVAQGSAHPGDGRPRFRDEAFFVARIPPTR